MKIDSIRADLRHLALLAKEYREKIPESVEREIQALETKVKQGKEINEYDRQYLCVVREEQRVCQNAIYDQVVYFAEKVLLQLTKPLARLWTLEIDQGRINKALQALNKDEANLLKAVLELCANLEELDYFQLEASRSSELTEPRKEAELRKLLNLSGISI